MTEKVVATGALEAGTYWQHKRLDKQARIARFMGEDVQVIDDRRNTIRWLSIRGFTRDYYGIPAPEKS